MYYLAAGIVPPSGVDLFSGEGSNIDKGLRNIIQKAMIPEAQNRYMSVKEVKDAVSSLIQNRAKTVVLDTKKPEAGFDKTEVMQRPAAASGGAIKPKRNIKRILAGVLVFFLLIAGAQYLLRQGSKAWSTGVNKNINTGRDSGENKTVTPTPTSTPAPTPAPTSTPVPTPPKDIAVEGVIYRNAPIILNSSSKPKGKDKDDSERDIFYKVNPAAEAGRFNDKFRMELSYLEFKGEDAAVYCVIGNNTGRDIGISLKDTYLLNEKNEGTKVDGSGIIYIKDGTDRQEIKIPFENFKFDTKISH
jgi:hypothetical protein